MATAVGHHTVCGEVEWLGTAQITNDRMAGRLHRLSVEGGEKRVLWRQGADAVDAKIAQRQPLWS